MGSSQAGLQESSIPFPLLLNSADMHYIIYGQRDLKGVVGFQICNARTGIAIWLKHATTGVDQRAEAQRDSHYE